jgi:glutathione peroxidase-family protein
VKWNFTKFLVGKDGPGDQALCPQRRPRIALRADIEAALAA